MLRSSHLAELANGARRNSGSSDSSFASTEPALVDASIVPTTKQGTMDDFVSLNGTNSTDGDYKAARSVTFYKKGAGGLFHDGGDKLRSFRVEDGSIVYSDGEVRKGGIPGNSILNFEQDNGAMFIHTVNGGKYRPYELKDGDDSNGTFEQMSGLIEEAISTSDNKSLLAQKIAELKCSNECKSALEEQLKIGVRKVSQFRCSLMTLTQKVEAHDARIAQITKQHAADIAQITKQHAADIARVSSAAYAAAKVNLEQKRAITAAKKVEVARDDSRTAAVCEMATSNASLVRQHSGTGIRVCG